MAKATRSTDKPVSQGHTHGESDALLSGRRRDDVVNQQPVSTYGTVDNRAAATASASSIEPPSKDDRQTVAWRDLPQKRQLAIITLARMSEPLVQTSLRAYMFYQLKWFNPALSDAVISSQAGVLFASFTAAQLFTTVMWARIADSPRVGRKNVILIGLLGTSLSCLGYGFSTSFWQVLLFRALSGITNGNVAVMRTMISEIIVEKRFQTRGFLLLPIASNIGNILGPILGGVLADPAGAYPDLFGQNRFFINFPYATPNIVSSFLLFLAAVGVWLGLEETLGTIRQANLDRDSQSAVPKAAWYTKFISKTGRRKAPEPHTAAQGALETWTAQEEVQSAHQPQAAGKRSLYTQVLPFRRIFTGNLTLVMLAQFFVTMHIGTFNSVWAVFLSTPVYDPRSSTSQNQRQLPFKFTGGLGFPPRSIGAAMAVIGVVGVVFQLLFYPRISAALGTLASWRIFLYVYPFTYLLMPYLSVVPSVSEPPLPKTGVLIWTLMCALLSLHVVATTFVLPSQFILLNNCSPHPSVLATVHGLGHSISCFARTIGPTVGGVLYGLGLNAGYVGLVFWVLSGIAICACAASLLVSDGNGHEIWLDGDEQE